LFPAALLLTSWAAIVHRVPAWVFVTNAYSRYHCFHYLVMLCWSGSSTILLYLYLKQTHCDVFSVNGYEIGRMTNQSF
jgi:hypothetical protein